MTTGGLHATLGRMNERDMTLARDWDFRDCTHYFWSEKFDGCRAYWDGFQLWTRGGHVIMAPDWFKAALPHGVPLDGEVWCGRGGYIEAMNAVRHGLFTRACKFVAFDAPDGLGFWPQRMATADLFRSEVVMTPERGLICSRDEPSERAARIIAEGGEGLMLRHPDVNRYERKRTLHLLRIKEKNLYAPWHNMSPRRPKATPGVVGLDVGLFPHDPEIEWNISRLLGAARIDLRAVTKI